MWAQSLDDNGPIGPPPAQNTVPEPESFALVAMALGIAVGLRVRRAKQRARKNEQPRDGE